MENKKLQELLDMFESENVKKAINIAFVLGKIEELDKQLESKP